MSKPFAERIALMNEMYRLPKHSVPTIPVDVVDRLILRGQRDLIWRSQKTNHADPFKLIQPRRKHCYSFGQSQPSLISDS